MKNCKFKLSLVFVIIFLVSTICKSQNVDYNKIIIPRDVQPKDVLEKLIQLAWQNHPTNQIYNKEMEIARHNIAISRWSWMDRITGRFNLNEANINPDVAPENRYYPRYNFSMTIDLGMFVRIPMETRIQKGYYEISKLSLEDQKLRTRTTVIERYQKYRLAKEIFTIESTALEDVYAIFVLNEQDFKNGNLVFEEYIQSKKAYNTQLINKVKAESEFLISEANLEELLGIQIEEVLD